MTTVTLEKAQHNLPALVERALSGEEIVIEQAGRLVKLAPVPAAQARTDDARSSYRGRGALKGKLVVGPEFFEPLRYSEDVAAD